MIYVNKKQNSQHSMDITMNAMTSQIRKVYPESSLKLVLGKFNQNINITLLTATKNFLHFSQNPGA